MGLFDPSLSPGGGAPANGRGTARGPSLEFRLLILGPIYLAAIVGAVLAGFFVYYTATIPNPMALRQKENAPIVRILARDGSVLAERGGAAPYIPIDLLPKHLIDAVLAIEDRRFFSHRGVDPTGLGRAILTNLKAGRVVQGGSTITQQLAKNVFLSSERTLLRKLEELVLALWLELRLSKPDILELYLNRVYFGAGAYGVESAARRFFNKGAQEVTMAEAAVLAGLLKAPSKYSPAWNPALARERAQGVLAKMVEAGFASPIDEALNSAAAVRFAEPQVMRGETGVEYAVDAVLDRLPDLIAGNDREIIVETTIDRGLQQRAQQIVHDLLASDGRSLDASQAAMVLLDMEGGITVLVGGRSYGESQFNRALRARRQPGSSFKPFVYLVALEAGLTPDSIVHDLPVITKGWSPSNDDGRYRGAMTLRDALARSINTVAVRLNMTHGPRKTVEAAHRLGISSELRPDASLALGTSEVTLLELTGAYGAFASGGRRLAPAYHQARAHQLWPHTLRARPGRPAHRARRAARRRHQRHAERGADLRDRQARRAAAAPGQRQDRHHAGVSRRLVRRLHRAPGRRRLGRQRRSPPHEPRDGRQSAGQAVARGDDAGARRPHTDRAARHGADRSAGSGATSAAAEARRPGRRATAAHGSCVSRARAWR